MGGVSGAAGPVRNGSDWKPGGGQHVIDDNARDDERDRLGPAQACPVARTRVQSAGRGPARRDHPAQVDPEASYYAFRFSCTQRVSFAQTRLSAASDHPRLCPLSGISPRSARFGWERGSYSVPASSWRITCWGYGAGPLCRLQRLLRLTQYDSVSGLLHGSRIRRARNAIFNRMWPRRA